MVEGAKAGGAAGICIEFNEPGCNYRAGGKVDGVVKLSIDGFYDASSLVLNLKGEDFVQYV